MVRQEAVAQMEVKAAGPGEDESLAEGQFTGYASVFGNRDVMGDIVEPGAFTASLKEWADSGATIPVLWGHDMSDPFANIGGVVSAEEDEHGLKVTGQLDVEDNPTARQVYHLLKQRRTDRMSFAYEVRGSQDAKDGTHLTELGLFEVSIVQVPANPMAEVTTVKAAADVLAKAGRTLSTKNENVLREARDAIDSVLASLGDDEAKASDDPSDGSDTTETETESKTDWADHYLAVISIGEKGIEA